MDQYEFKVKKDDESVNYLKNIKVVVGFLYVYGIYWKYPQL